MRLPRLTKILRRAVYRDDTMRVIEPERTESRPLPQVSRNAVDTELRQLSSSFGSTEYLMLYLLRTHHQIERDITQAEEKLAYYRRFPRFKP
jgi:hypothetical protein